MKKVFAISLLIVFFKAGAQTSALSVADSLFGVGKYAEAIKVYQKVNPATATVYLKMAQAYRAQGNFGKALANYELGLNKNPSSPAAISNYGNLLYQTKNFKKADSIFRVLTKTFPKNPDFHYLLGLTKKKLGDSTAIVNFQKVFKLDETHQKAIYELAVHQFKNKNYKKVESLGVKALESYPENVEILSLLGQNAMVSQKYQLAAKRFEQLISLNENSEFIYENLALAYYHLAELKKAIVHYQILINLNPQHIKAHYFSGKIYNLLDQPEKAEPHLKNALKLKKMGLSGMYQALGTSFKLKKSFSEAIDYYKLALKENQYNLRAQFDLAVAADEYYKDLETRLNYYKIFVKKFKDFPNAKTFLAFAEYRISELKKERFLEEGE